MTGIDRVRLMLEEANGNPVSVWKISRMLWPDGQRPKHAGPYVRTCMQRLRARGFTILHVGRSGYVLSRSRDDAPLADRARAALARLRANAASVAR